MHRTGLPLPPLSSSSATYVAKKKKGPPPPFAPTSVEKHVRPNTAAGRETSTYLASLSPWSIRIDGLIRYDARDMGPCRGYVHVFRVNCAGWIWLVARHLDFGAVETWGLMMRW